MSDPRRPAGRDPLDDAIDAALARTVRREASAHLRARVVGRLAESASPRVWLRAAAVAAAAAVLLAVALWPHGQPARHEQRSAATPAPHTPSVIAAPRVPGPAAAPGVARPPALTVRTASPGGPLAPKVEDEATPPDTEATDLARLETPALTIEPLVSPASSEITPLAREAVVVAPLSIEDGESTQPEDKP